MKFTLICALVGAVAAEAVPTTFKMPVNPETPAEIAAEKAAANRAAWAKE